MYKYSFHIFCGKYENSKALHVKRKIRNGEFIGLITAYWAVYFCVIIFSTEFFSP